MRKTGQLTLYQKHKMLDLSKFKAFADNNLNVPKMAKFVCDRV